MKKLTLDEFFIIGSIEKSNEKESDLYISYPSYYYELKCIVKRLRDYFNLEKEVA